MKCVIYPTHNGYAFTTLKNYTSYVQYVSRITFFENDAFHKWTYEEVLEEVCRRKHITEDDIVPCPY